MKDIERKYIRRYKRSESIVFRKTKAAFGGLSNMAAGYPIELGDINIATSEALYQALRYPDFPDIQKEILSITNPMKAKMCSRKYSHLTRRDWGRIRTSIMRLVLQIKYINNKDKFGALLLSTNELPIVEESYRDIFWGARPIDQEVLEGVNALGRLLMELRVLIKRENKNIDIDIPFIPNLMLLGQPLTAFIYCEKHNNDYVNSMMQVPLFGAEEINAKYRSDILNQLRPYPAYKDSGVPWLGKVPKGWGVKKVRQVAGLITSNVDKKKAPGEIEVRLCNYMEVYENEFITEELPFMQATATQEEIRKFEVKKGDVVMTKDSEIWTDIGVPAYVDYEAPNLVYGYHLAILRPRPEAIEGKYLFRALQSQPVATQLHVEATGVTRFGLSQEAIKSTLLPLPPLPEQHSIVRFLDWADRRIRFVIAARKRRIQLLEEYRQVLINDAVTGKFDVRTGKPYPSYKDSGVPWLEKMPEEWEIKPLKHWVRINQHNLTEETDPNFEFEYYDIGSVGTGKLVAKPEIMTFKNAPSRARRVLRPGDTLFSTVRTYLKATFTYWESQNSNMPAIASTGFAVLSPSPKSWPGFVSFLTQTEAFSNYVAALSVGIAYPAISETTFGAIKVPVPPLPEQRAIAEYLDRETAKIDAAIEKTKESIALWEELRETLISEVVTGKLDVREVAEKLPEEEPELEEKVKALEGLLLNGENETSGADYEPELESAEETA